MYCKNILKQCEFTILLSIALIFKFLVDLELLNSLKVSSNF